MAGDARKSGGINLFWGGRSMSFVAWVEDSNGFSFRIEVLTEDQAVVSLWSLEHEDFVDWAACPLEDVGLVMERTAKRRCISMKERGDPPAGAASDIA